MLSLIIICIVIALLFDFLNGMNDAANSIATIVSTGVLSPRAAVVWAAFFNFISAFILGVHVANTIGKGIVDPSIINPWFILSALLGAIAWVFACTRLGIPISVSHALVGGLLGPAIIAGGTKYIIFNGIVKVAVFIFLSPMIGFIVAFTLMTLTLWIFRNRSSVKVNKYFKGLQLLSSAVFSLGHGSNDAQKTMGIIAVLLFSTGYLGEEFYIPLWVILAAHASIALGTWAGGWRVIKTLGINLTTLKPIHGFNAETAGALTVIGNTLAGIPVSTTHTISGAIMGVGATRRLSAVRWHIALRIILAWIFTVPVATLISAILYAFVLWFS